MSHEGARVDLDPRPGVGGGFRSQLLPALTLVMLLAASLGLFAVSRHVVRDQEKRLLSERASEVGALLTNAVGTVESSLKVLGPIGAASGTEQIGQFATAAGQLIEGSTKAVGVAREDGAGFVVMSAVGDGPPVGAVLADGRALLAERALALDPPQLVADLVPERNEVRLVFARAVGDGRAVVFEETVINPGQPAASTPDSPFRELRVALYASPDVDPQRLVLTTEADVPLSGRVVRIPFPVGADRWLLGVGARGPMVGSFTHNVPWLFLGGGSLMAVLAAAIVETLARRRAYGLRLVAQRTRELEGTLTELGATRAFLERLLLSGPVVVSRIRVADREVTYLSPNAERIIGLSFADVADPEFTANVVHPDDLSQAAAAMERVIHGRSDHETLEYRLRTAGDTYRWISVTLVPEPDDDGHVVAVLAYTVDVDDRRRAEDARREAYEVAETANKSKSEFLSRMSHELRTPLNAVLGFGQLLEIETLTSDQHDAVDHILKGGRHLLNLINEVLDISRIEAGEMSLSPESVLASQLVDEAVDLVRPLATQRDTQLVVDSSGLCDCYVFADRQRAKQILLNLLSNSIKYNRPHGTIALSCSQPDMTRVRISVADTGLGIPAERLGLLFTPFERLGAENTAEEGTGIGLALSRRLAEAMGGTLTATSTLGQGSTFTLELPRVEGSVERYERLNTGDPPVEPARPGRVVLHIEDNLANLTLVQRILARRPGISVVPAMYGRLALELAREHDPILVLLDLHLPDMGGEHVLQRLREDPVTASIPVVIVSADASPGQVQRLLSAGAVAYLTKPIVVRDLLGLVDGVLGADAKVAVHADR